MTRAGRIAVMTGASGGIGHAIAAALAAQGLSLCLTMQQRVRAFEGKSYDAGILLQPSDVAEVVVHALTLPETAEVTDIAARLRRKPSDERRSP